MILSIMINATTYFRLETNQENFINNSHFRHIAHFMSEIYLLDMFLEKKFNVGLPLCSRLFVTRRACFLQELWLRLCCRK